ncbi:hypothetical protein BS47DRAFT_767679 [Hydnum rufescens UP504]|uniref:Uncharacterized protein n=1 Tax=Hydnum rufescens UP504 TaxID=1448309 RepID=A0A9P6B0T2_9AGAM|nr:hypothetical protein BS47DRAFT_767679 [Hydnum rufescens UP504]
MGYSMFSGRAATSCLPSLQMPVEGQIVIRQLSTQRDQYDPPSWPHRRHSEVASERPSAETVSLRSYIGRLRRPSIEIHPDAVVLPSPKPPGDDLERVQSELHHTQEDLRRTQAELATLRNRLQLHETVEPGQIAHEFRAINRSVKHLCRTITAFALRQQKFAQIPYPTSSDVADLELLAHTIQGRSEPPSLVQSANGPDRPLEDVLEYGLRSVVNRYLHNRIFRPFHPELYVGETETGVVSERLWDIYESMCRHDAQISCGKWRASTFSALERTIPPLYADTVIRDITQSLEKNGFHKIFDALYGVGWTLALSDAHHSLLEQVVRQAYDWNRKVRSEVVLLDYHPQIEVNDASLDHQTMVLLEKPRVPLQSKKIICALTLGLQSSEAQGDGSAPEFVWHEKVQVLVSEYFDDP